MPTLRQIQRRIRSIQSTAKTTRAMSLVAGSKMRRAQQMALAHRPYADQLRFLLADVFESLTSVPDVEGETLHPLLQRREIATSGLLLITPDRGLCGGLNTNLIRAAGAFIAAHPVARATSSSAAPEWR
jgi:F-type H+-transporting ATPase subunit gamma